MDDTCKPLYEVDDRKGAFVQKSVKLSFELPIKIWCFDVLGLADTCHQVNLGCSVITRWICISCSWLQKQYPCQLNERVQLWWQIQETSDFVLCTLVPVTFKVCLSQASLPECLPMCCSGPLPPNFSNLKYLSYLNIEESGLDSGRTTNSRGEFLPEMLEFDRFWSIWQSLVKSQVVVKSLDAFVLTQVQAGIKPWSIPAAL